MFGECHLHIFMDGVNFREAKKIYLNGVDKTDVRRKLSEYADAGILFLRDGGDDLGASAYAKRIASGYGIDYRTPIYAIHKNGHYGSIVGRGFDTMEEYARLVRGVEKAGGDFIKVMFSGILDFNRGGEITGTALTKDEIREMIHIAHEEGFAVMAHVNGAGPVLDAIEAGVDSVEHGNFMDEETIQALSESRTVWVPTQVTVHNLIGCGRYDDEVLKILDQKQRENIRRAFDAGAMIALGSDAGAYRVDHVFGTLDEYHRMQEIIPDRAALDAELTQAQKEIEKRFRKF